jgi:glycosyltransferase involved in cell wall biosynthesis
MKNPLVSIVVTTRNNEATLDACLRSVISQTYAPTELIVVDNQSSDSTKDIARRYTELVFDKGPERSAQRNFAVRQARGEYVLIVDSDMELTWHVVEACIEKVTATPEIKALIIPEESFGRGFWAQCKRLERSFYVGVEGIEAARFFDRELYRQAGGYDEAITGGEDWNLTDRIMGLTKIGRIHEYIFHNEGRISLSSALKKRFYYNQGFLRYYNEAKTTGSKSAAGSVLRYYKIYLSRPSKLLKNPLYGLGMLYMKTCEFSTGALSMVAAKMSRGQAP